MKIIINAITSKKSAGGAFQISSNFLRESLNHSDIEWYWIVSEDLDAVLGKDFVAFKGTRYFVFPTQPDFKHTYFRVRRELCELEQRIKPDVIYTITAPSYFSFNTTEVMRFTNPLVTHPNKYSWKVQSLKAKMRIKAYCWNQKRMMRKAHYFVTQTEFTKKGIIRITGEPNNHVRVVSNVLPAAFAQQDNTHIDNGSGWIEVACVGAPVPHKNFDILPNVLVELSKLGINKVRFHTTIPENDPLWERIKNELIKHHLEENVKNHGRVSQAELAEMYRYCSFCFLPTLLEVFSASTVEAMFYDLKIVATDFPFNREVLQGAALYYEPMNAKDAAAKFAELMANKGLQAEFSVKMKKQMALYGDYSKHFYGIKEFLVEVGEGSLKRVQNKSK